MPTDSLATFLHRVLTQGRVLLKDVPAPDRKQNRQEIEVLRKLYRVALRDIVGPRLAFHEAAATDAARVLHLAAWGLVNRSERPEALLRDLRMREKPASPEAHYSADLTLRYLPHLWSRARRIDPSDVLVAALEKLLREWPLSGVLAGLDEGPSGIPDFGGHPGLMMLYAERFAQHPRDGWRPTGALTSYVELVEQEMATLNSHSRRSAGC